MRPIGRAAPVGPQPPVVQCVACKRTRSQVPGGKLEYVKANGFAAPEWFCIDRTDCRRHW